MLQTNATATKSSPAKIGKLFKTTKISKKISQYAFEIRWPKIFVKNRNFYIFHFFSVFDQNVQNSRFEMFAQKDHFGDLPISSDDSWHKSSDQNMSRQYQKDDQMLLNRKSRDLTWLLTKIVKYALLDRIPDSGFRSESWPRSSIWGPEISEIQVFRKSRKITIFVKKLTISEILGGGLKNPENPGGPKSPVLAHIYKINRAVGPFSLGLAPGFPEIPAKKWKTARGR